MTNRLALGAAAIGGFFLAVFGVWAVFGPRSFYDRVALWPPYNHHFVHDIGAFQIGLGLTLLLALRYRDSLLVALLGAGIGQTIHAIVHAIDRDLGGQASDPLVMAVLAALLLAGAFARWRAADLVSTRP